jgi:murein DD-endopeptidase MepM/ murein hydrolase activator NlpD
MRLALLTSAALALTPAAALASPGGAAAPSAGASSGGVAYGAPVARATRLLPVATRFSVTPARVVSGRSLPRIVLRIDEPGVRSVRARVVLMPVAGGAIARLDLGAVRTGRTVRRNWPRGTVLVPGRYLVRVHAKDPAGRTLLRRARTSGRTGLRVDPAPVAPPPAPAPAPLVPAASTGTALPAPPPSATGLFPVRGPWSFGDGFSAPRTGYAHQGVDILAAEGTPVVAPVAGTIAYTDYQASGAGYYVVQRAADGRAFFYAHCQKGSVAVVPGQAVAQGAPLCSVGHTGDATGPHLHFELWPSGWRDVKGTQPVDPMALLRSWAQLG